MIISWELVSSKPRVQQFYCGMDTVSQFSAPFVYFAGLIVEFSQSQVEFKGIA